MKNIKEIIGGSLVASLIAVTGFVALEAQIVSAVTDTIVVDLTVTEGISITQPVDVTMTTLAVGTNDATGTAAWTVITNSQGGYTLNVGSATGIGNCTGGDALCNDTDNEKFTDYPTPSTNWAVSGTSYEFGFTAFGNDTTGWIASACGTGSTPSAGHYEGFGGSYGGSIEIASSTGVTSTSGTATNICYVAGQNGVFAPAGNYQATTTATAATQ